MQLEPDNVGDLCLKNDCRDELIIRIAGIYVLVTD